MDTIPTGPKQSSETDFCSFRVLPAQWLLIKIYSLQSLVTISFNGAGTLRLWICDNCSKIWHVGIWVSEFTLLVWYCEEVDCCDREKWELPFWILPSSHKGLLQSITIWCNSRQLRQTMHLRCTATNLEKDFNKNIWGRGCAPSHKPTDTANLYTLALCWVKNSNFVLVYGLRLSLMDRQAAF